jgi:hypothetical protein
LRSQGGRFRARPAWELPLALARLAVGDNPEVGPILQDLRAVRVYVYDAVHDAGRVERQIRAVRAGLPDDGWKLLATCRGSISIPGSSEWAPLSKDSRSAALRQGTA